MRKLIFRIFQPERAMSRNILESLDNNLSWLRRGMFSMVKIVEVNVDGLARGGMNA
jgi:hypothetical protein